MGKPLAEVNLLSDTDIDLPHNTEEVGDINLYEMTDEKLF